jgi:hypothetical protein
MKNYWIKRKEDKEKVVVFKGIFQKAYPNINKRIYSNDVWIKEMNDNAWHHLLEVANGDDHKLYVDGVIHEKLLD